MKNETLKVTVRILSALALGALVGLVFNYMQTDSYSEVLDVFVNGFIGMIGDLFMNAIKMMVVPLVFISITLGAASMVDLRKFGRMGGKILGLYIFTTICACIIGIVLANAIQPGAGFDAAAAGIEATYTAPEAVSFWDTIANIIPQNPIKMLVEGNMLQIIFFGIFFGITMAMLEEKSKPIKTCLEAFEVVVVKMVTLVMKMAPIGVFALITVTFTNLGIDVIASLASYCITVWLGLAIQLFIVYGLLLMVLGKLNPLKLFKKMIPAWAVAFSTSSSNATLPVTTSVVEDSIGVDKEVAAFTLPLGATMNMDGTAIMEAVAILFIAQACGIDMTTAQMVMIVVVCTLASIGTAAVPSANIVTLSMILPLFGLPVEMIGILLAVDRIIAMSLTVVNVTGDAICTTIIAKSENNFNEDIFNAKEVAA